MAKMIGEPLPSPGILARGELFCGGAQMASQRAGRSYTQPRLPTLGHHRDGPLKSGHLFWNQERGLVARRAVDGTPASPPEESVVLEGGYVEFYRREYPGAVRLAGLLAGTSSAAEDIAQDALMILRERFDQVDNPSAYLRGVVVNCCRHWHRDRAQIRRRWELLRIGSRTVDELGANELADVVEKLPFRQRVVVVGRYWGDWSEAEIADALGCRPGTVKSLASRAMATLRRQLRDVER
jgi:RNA polymerase sigma factor (sigma-70 family)